MKKCAYCGRANEDDAVSCHECGTNEFKLSPGAESAGGGGGSTMSATCRVCGATTDAAESFVTRQRAFRNSPETWCPLCWQKRAASSGLGVLVVTGALGVLGLLCLCLLPARSLGLFLLNAFFFQLSVMLSMAIHASAHAYAGHRLGWRIFMVPLGLGKTVFKGKVFGFETVLRAIPWCGLVAAAPRDTAHYRLKLFTFSAAGLFANVILLAASLLIMWVSSDHFGRLTSELDFIQMLFFANLGIISGNLWPGFIFTTFGRQASDGRRLLHALNRDPNKREQSHAGWFVGEGALCHAKQEYEAARTWFEKGLQLYPENVHLLVSKGNSLLALKEFREARQVFNSLLPRVQNDRPVLATVLNNLAYADVALEDGELLEEADRYSKDAMSTLGWHPAINGTRGAVLLEMGRVDEALPLLRRAMRLHEDPVGKAQVACWLAIAQARKGDLATSGKFLEEAVNAIRGLSEEQRQRTSSRANS